MYCAHDSAFSINFQCLYIASDVTNNLQPPTFRQSSVYYLYRCLNVKKMITDVDNYYLVLTSGEKSFPTLENILA